MKKRRKSKNYSGVILALVFLVILAAFIMLAPKIIEKTMTFPHNTELPTENPSEQENIVSQPSHQPSQTIPEDSAPRTETPKLQYDPADNPAVRISVTPESEWNLILVNPWNKLPEDFTVELVQLKNGHSVDKRAYEDLQQMMDDARADGLDPYICSSYRTYNKQSTLFANEVNSYINQGYDYYDAISEGGKWVAVPGTSEHQTGLALDIVAMSYPYLNEQQEDTAEQKWLMENSYKYGWILRYPSDKSELTGIYYEPWHYRYVGKEAAKEMFEKDMCFEEYLAQSKEV